MFPPVSNRSIQREGPPVAWEASWCIPLKSAKHDRASGRSADGAFAEIQAREEDGRGQEAREPEDHGHGLGGQDAKLVRGRGQETRRKGEIGHGEGRGPDAGEDEEVDL